MAGRACGVRRPAGSPRVLRRGLRVRRRQGDAADRGAVIDEFVAVPCSEVVGTLGEGVVWDHARQELLWVDVLAGLLYRGRPATAIVEEVGRLALGCPVGAVVPAQDGGWIVAAGPGFARLSADGELTWLAKPAGG